MDATTLTADGPLPDDVTTLQALVRQLLAEVARLRGDNADLRGRLDAALRHRFGRRSERQRTPPLPRPARPGPATPHGRGALPDHLERREVVYDLTEAEKSCPCCGRPRTCIGEHVTEQLDLEPARCFVRRVVRKSYACRHCPAGLVPVARRFRTAGPDRVGPIAAGLCGPGLLAHAVTAKYADHVPLHRLAGQLARTGVQIAASTLGDWVAAAARLLMPLALLMHQRVLRSRVIHSDDTGVKLRVPGAPKTHKAHLWVVIGDPDFPYVLFVFTADYTAAGPEEFLAGYRGYLQADALAQYEGLYRPGRVVHACCLAHARRKFVAALEGGDARAQPALTWIGRLYAVERDLPPLLPPADGPQAQQQRRQREEQRRQLRQQRARPILAEWKAWLEEQKPQALPKSRLGQAIGYALGNWEALGRYVEQGYLAIDNNLSERTLRSVALGRNNWGVLGSEQGGATAAVLYSVIGTCKHLGIDPFGYLREALPGLYALGESPHTEDLLEWLPDLWSESRAQSRPLEPAATG
jgi:transposase